ncbi:MAG: MBL fold metallo-hydrolase [Acutalibacteraceae bacterium]
MTRLCPLFSGSSGNSYYIGSADNGILIDAGRSAKQIENALKENDLDIKNVRAIFVTHEHSDHIQGLRVLASRHKIKVYSSMGTISALEEKQLINEKVDISPITFDGVEAAGMNIVPFRISHDCCEGFGYVVESSDGRKTAFATDTGYISNDIKSALCGCDTVVIESNHDVRMLENGIYPYILKRRILSDKGHLSNDSCADELLELVRSGTTRFLLAHLSRENNMPELALQTSLCNLESNGMKRNIDFMISVAPVENFSGSIIY